MPYNINGTDYIQSLDSGDLKDFYARVRGGAMPTTSQINAETFYEAFKPVVEEGQDIICIAFSSALSGNYSGAVTAAGQLALQFPDRKISVIDSLCASLGEGLLIHYTLQQLNAGKSHDEIVAWVEANKLAINHWFTVDDLHYLHRGGRLSGTAAMVGSILGIKPVLHMSDEGKLEPVEKKKGRRRALQGLFSRLDSQGLDINGQDIFISHGDCLEDAEYVKSLILAKYPACKFIINYVGAVIGSHSGPGTVALFFVGTHR